MATRVGVKRVDVDTAGARYGADRGKLLVTNAHVASDLEVDGVVAHDAVARPKHRCQAACSHVVEPCQCEVRAPASLRDPRCGGLEAVLLPGVEVELARWIEA